MGQNQSTMGDGEISRGVNRVKETKKKMKTRVSYIFMFASKQKKAEFEMPTDVSRTVRRLSSCWSVAGLVTNRQRVVDRTNALHTPTRETSPKTPKGYSPPQFTLLSL